MENLKQLRLLSKLEIKLKYLRALVLAPVAETLCCVLEVLLEMREARASRYDLLIARRQE